MSDLSPALPAPPADQHLVITLMNGLTSPVLRIEPGRVEWWWMEAGNVLQFGPTENCPDADDYVTVYIPREHIALIQVSTCHCDHTLTSELDNWLGSIFNSAPTPPTMAEEDNPEGQ